MTLVVPVGAICHQHAMADEVLRSLLLEPGPARQLHKFRRKELLDHVGVGQAQPRLTPIPIYEPLTYENSQPNMILTMISP